MSHLSPLRGRRPLGRSSHLVAGAGQDQVAACGIPRSEIAANEWVLLQRFAILVLFHMTTGE